MIADAISSLHWPTKLRPRESAAKALYSRGRLVSTIGATNIYWSSALERPA
jgi:hypothetical protein